MKKKALCMVLAVALLATVMGGCGTKNESGTQSEVLNTQSVSDTQTTEETQHTEIVTETQEKVFEKTGGPIVVDYDANLPTEAEKSDIFVEKIDGLSDSFIKGMDISSVLAQEASGVKYYNTDGQEEDLFKILADSGVNYIRVRVWNNPFDSEGNGYGGGNCDVSTAAEIGKRAAEYGMKLLVDFHYSDFWADPAKQMVPKAWKDCTVEEKSSLLYDYTVDSLNEIINNGANVGMVQVGNEINNGMCGEDSLDNKLVLVKSGCEAVREVADFWDMDIKVALHYTNIDNPDNIMQIVEEIKNAGIDYDIFGVSYYPYWHGDMENLTNLLTQIKTNYGVDTCVLETSYMYTGDDGDGSANSASDADEVDGYPCSVQGQANCVRDVMAAANAAGSLGVFYWEGAWVPVGSDYTTNQSIWESNGSGWASSFAKEYDPKDAGNYYGGSSWDNQAFFDFEGKELASLDVFKYVNYGAYTDTIEVLGVKNPEIEIPIGEDFVLPDEVDAYYNDSSCTDPVKVEWNADEKAAIDADTAATYTVHGTAATGQEVTATIKVANANYVINPGFEDADTSMWTVTEASSGTTDVQNKASDAHSGEYSFHFWSESDVDFSVEQNLGILSHGVYSASVFIQGGDVGSNAEFVLYVKIGDQIYESEPAQLTGWVEWKNPVVEDVEVDGSEEVIVGVRGKCAAKGWGTLDDFEVFAVH